MLLREVIVPKRNSVFSLLLKKEKKMFLHEAIVSKRNYIYRYILKGLFLMLHCLKDNEDKKSLFYFAVTF